MGLTVRRGLAAEWGDDADAACAAAAAASAAAPAPTPVAAAAATAAAADALVGAVRAEEGGRHFGRRRRRGSGRHEDGT